MEADRADSAAPVDEPGGGATTPPPDENPGLGHRLAAVARAEHAASVIDLGLDGTNEEEQAETPIPSGICPQDPLSVDDTSASRWHTAGAI